MKTPRSSRRPARPGAAAGFTLLEILVALTIFSLAMSLTLVAYVAVLKRAFHTEGVLKGATEVRYAADRIAQSVRSASQEPVIAAAGLQLVLAPPNMGVLVVEDGTWIDQPNDIKGTKKNQRNLKLSTRVPSAAVATIFAASARPSGALAASDIATYFKTNANDVPQVDVNDVLQVGDVLTIPATAYGAEIHPVVNNISNSSNGTQTVTMTNNLPEDVPNGTRIRILHGPREMYEVRSLNQSNSGDLRYYPDNRNLTRFVVLAHDIVPDPLVNFTDAASARTVPFALSGRNVTINLQRAPRGTTAGRTIQGAQTTVLARTDPSIP